MSGFIDSFLSISPVSDSIDSFLSFDSVGRCILVKVVLPLDLTIFQPQFTMGQENSGAISEQAAMGSGYSCANQLNDDIDVDLTTEMRDEHAKTMAGATTRVDMDLHFHVSRSDHLARKFREQVVLDPMQVQYLRVTQRNCAAKKATLAGESKKATGGSDSIQKVTKSQQLAQQLSAVRHHVVNEIATSTVEGDEALSRLPVARRLIEEKNERIRKLLSEIEELKSEYRKLKKPEVVVEAPVIPPSPTSDDLPPVMPANDLISENKPAEQAEHVDLSK